LRVFYSRVYTDLFVNAKPKHSQKHEPYN